MSRGEMYYVVAISFLLSVCAHFDIKVYMAVFFRPLTELESKQSRNEYTSFWLKTGSRTVFIVY